MPDEAEPRNATPRRVGPDEAGAIAEIINAAAERYRGVIPDDCLGEPYMSRPDLDRELAAGVAFWGVGEKGALAGVMGVQRVKDVTLIRHAYVRPEHQGSGIGARLLDHCRGATTGPVLIGTWAAADWAIRFYRRHGFVLAEPEQIQTLLATYWTVSLRQAAVSVVLQSAPDQPIGADR